MKNKILTIDDLYQFCKTNKFYNFDSKTYGAPLIIQSIENFEAGESQSNGLMPVKLKSCHTGKNANKSGISDEVMNKYKNTFKGKPILGSIHKTDTGEYEFGSHDMEIVKDENGDAEINYIEQPVGVISEIDEPYLEYDKDQDKSYLMVKGNIFTNYSKAAEILERRRTCKCSVEIAVEDMSYNCDEDYLSIDAFEFMGVTILGYEQDGTTEIQEGMKGSKITIDDFSLCKNSMKYEQYQDALIETLNKLNSTLEGFNKIDKEGGEDGMKKKMNEEVVEEEAVVEEEVVEETTEEQTEESVVETSEEGTVDTEASEKIDEETTEEEEVTTDAVVEESEEAPASEPENFVKNFSVQISHEDIRCALYNLITPFEEEDNDYYYIRDVYDDYFYMQGMYDGKIYKVGYGVDGENVKLSGDREEMFELIITKDEKDAIEEMRSNYSELIRYKEDNEKAKIVSQKNSIFNNAKYSSVFNTKAFQKLVNDSENYSVKECEEKAEDIYSDFSTFATNFSEGNSVMKLNTLSFVSTSPEKTEDKPYGNLFDKD